MFRESLFLVLSFIFAFLTCDTDARTWDLAVMIGQQIDFFAQNGTLTGQANVAQAMEPTGLAYDNTTRILYLSDSQNENVSIYSNNLAEKNFTSTTLLKKQSGTHILGIVFDTISRTLFWTDVLVQAIMKMHVPLNNQPEVPQILHNLTYKSPRGITIDMCNRYIYWANSNSTNPSIERSKLDGSDRTVVVNSSLYEPVSVAVDHTSGKLYWIDDKEGIHYKIERSNLDGSDRELLIHGSHQQPVHIAVDRDFVYWADWVYSAIWVIKKNIEVGDIPAEFKSYYSSKRDSDPSSIITRDNVGSIDCEIMFKLEREATNRFTSPPIVTESFSNLTTSTEEVNSMTDSAKSCLHDGHYNELDHTCDCKPGGPLCEISLCHNYCFGGQCVVDINGKPRCECRTGYSGGRCEFDMCDRYCLHDGQCVVKDGKPFCTCKYARGARCEDKNDTDEICNMFCASGQPTLNSIDMSFCRCSETNQTSAQTMSYGRSNILLTILSALVGVLTILVAVLSYYVSKLRQRPRIKKRFVISKGGVTPLTSRPQVPGDQCEITIENCCNMNICETPCFEPKLRNTPNKSNGVKKEEKNSLLDNMEGDLC